MEKLLPANAVLEDLVGYQLQLASSAFLSDWVETSGAISIRRIQFALLAVIAENPGIRQGEAGNRLGIQRAYMVSLINELLEKGLIERKVDNDDRRALVLSLTSLGHKSFEAGLALIREHEDKMLWNFTKKDMAKLIQLLKKITRPAG